MEGEQMKILMLLFAVSLAAPAAWAQQLDVEFEIIEDAQAAGCAASIVTGLNPSGDGFLAVRSGPGTEYGRIDELHNGDMVRTCAMEGQWVGVYYGEPRQRGWVHGNWLAHAAG